MNYYVSPTLEIVRVEVMELQREQELRRVHNWFTDENKAKEMAKKVQEVLCENN